MKKNHQTNYAAKSTFGLLRHGLTTWNKEKRIQGRMNSPLTKEGKEKILNFTPCLRRFHWTKILASDLDRVKETICIINKDLKLPIYYDKRLREIDWGNWEGLRLQDIQHQYPSELEKQINAGWDFQAPGGEKRSNALRRGQNALLDATKKWPEEVILVVCHQGIIKCLLYDILKRSFLPNEKKVLIKNALHTIEIENGEFYCKELNIQHADPS